MTDISQFTNAKLNYEIGKALGYKFNVGGVRTDLVVSPDGDKVELPNWAGNVGEAFGLCIALKNKLNILYYPHKYVFMVDTYPMLYCETYTTYSTLNTSARSLSELILTVLQMINS